MHQRKMSAKKSSTKLDLANFWEKEINKKQKKQKLQISQIVVEIILQD